ncbi:uncharacterized protein IL334_000995 [Kwoniella shivajii]|uniref:WSC domain-containing protein n=1 Tax=Kwoniella shivajii TaxID=564305 RepID=A0ABZ1CRS6_9TREE|nr:hypothetical protein IL334_000995 [Kwoniella shivajii]
MTLILTTLILFLRLTLASSIRQLGTHPPPVLPDGTIVSPQYMGCINEQRFYNLIANGTGLASGLTSIQSDKGLCTEYCTRQGPIYSDAYYRQASQQCYCAEYLSPTTTSNMAEALDSYGSCRSADASILFIEICVYANSIATV